jgi:uncharacterized protein with NAD-binding domain and iron-sulfur cluster
MPPSSGPPLVVVGTGVAGLACALDLTAAGVAVRVLDASDGVGGRIRTDRQGGFLLDRSFQVFNTSYPLLPVSLIKRQPDRTTFAALTEAGISPALCELLFCPFLSGAFLEDELETSGRFFHWSGAACCAALSACPGAAFRRFPSSSRPRSPADTRSAGNASPRAHRRQCRAGERNRDCGQAVIVAASATEAAALLSGLSVPAMRTVITIYHAAPSAPRGAKPPWRVAAGDPPQAAGSDAVPRCDQRRTFRVLVSSLTK